MLIKRNFGMAMGASAVAVGDFNGDGRADLAVVSLSGNVHLFRGAGDGTFEPYDVVRFRAALRADIAVVNWESNNIAILHGRGAGRFDPPAFFGTDVRPGALSIGDINADGLPDMVVVNESNSVSILINDTAAPPRR